MLTARSGDQLNTLAEQLRSAGSAVATAAIDLTEPDSIGSALSDLLNRGDKPSVLINNAGAAYTGDLVSMPLDRWQWLLQLNLTSVMQVCSVVVPEMRAKGGLVINVSSHVRTRASRDVETK